MRNTELEFEALVIQSMNFTVQYVLLLEEWRISLLSSVSQLQFCNII
jgi:hypothetical protein